MQCELNTTALFTVFTTCGNSEVSRVSAEGISRAVMDCAPPLLEYQRSVTSLEKHCSTPLCLHRFMDNFNAIQSRNLVAGIQSASESSSKHPMIYLEYTLRTLWVEETEANSVLSRSAMKFATSVTDTQAQLYTCKTKGGATKEGLSMSHGVIVTPETGAYKNTTCSAQWTDRRCLHAASDFVLPQYFV